MGVLQPFCGRGAGSSGNRSVSRAEPPRNFPHRDAPDVDPLVFLAEAPQDLPALEAGQLRRCLITGSSLFDLEAHPVA